VQVPGFGAAEVSPPNLPATIALSAGDGPDRARYFTADADDGGHRYRVRASAELGSDSILVIATSLADVDATLRRLLLIELLVTAAVLAASPRSAFGSSDSACARSARSRRPQPRSPAGISRVGSGARSPGRRLGAWGWR
jgi:hypothetical protein